MESEKTKLARTYVKKFSKTGNKTIARKLKKEHPKMFKDVEDARFTVRKIKGMAGERNRGIEVKDKSLFTKEAQLLAGIFDDFEEGEMNDFEPYQIPKNIKKIGHMSDLHIPYHDINSIKLTLKRFLDEKVDCIIINGDLMDCYSLSRFQKDPTKRRFKAELDLVRDFLTRLRNLFPTALIVYKEGNHEERHEAILKIKSPEFYDIEEFQLDVLLRLRELDIQWVNHKRIIHAGKLNVLHGHEFGQQIFSPVNPARGFYMKAKDNTLAGHHHQTSEHSEPTLNGKALACWSIGALCDMHPDYRPINKWNLGFAIQTITDSSGSFRISNHRIIEGKVA